MVEGPCDDDGRRATHQGRWPMSRIDQQPGRARYESDTKKARKGYEKGMVWARFFAPLRCTTSFPANTYAAAKTLFLTYLRNEPAVHRSLPFVPPCLRASVPMCLKLRAFPIL